VRGETVVYAVIPAGGAGTRLWPRSRRATPKHVLPLSGSGVPLLRETYERVRPLADEVFVLTEARQIPAIRKVVPELKKDSFIVEPVARGTTNAFGLAAMTIREQNPDAVMVLQPADHVIRGTRSFRATIRRAAAVAGRSGSLVTIGLKPTHPATGFGYIEASEKATPGALRVERFVEKPNLERATEYLRSGRFYWNLAMFSWRADVFLEELERHGPVHYEGLKRVVRARAAGDDERAARLYGRLPVAAVDYTVMEKTDRLLLVPATFKWIDVGSWEELADLLPKDRLGNVVEGDTLLIDTESSLISSPDRLVAAIGVRDLVVIDTPDALLICPKSRSQEVKKLVEALGRSGRIHYL
jgi:mannose-1-phosphate guanylyltransferase/mannose-6-phosphate isomerase